MTIQSQFRQEILEQPVALRRILSESSGAIEEAAQRIRARGIEWVLIAARGSSDNAARYGQYVLGAHNQLGVGLAVPSLFTIYERPPRLDKALVIGISQSGQSPDILSVVTECRRQGGATLALTNDSGSPLARAAELHVSLAAGEERAVAATKTYTNELMALAMLSVALEADAHRKEQALALPDHVEAALAVEPVLAELGATFRNASKFLVIGRGYNYSTAFEVALKIKETSYVIAEPYSTADLLHGPVAMVDEGFPVVVIAPSGRAVAEVPKLLELLHSRRARVAVLSDREELLAQADAAVRLPSEVPEWLSPITSVVPGQLLALHLALGRGLDPDAPRGLSKVTLTK